MVKNDASFYTNSNSYEYVFEGERFSVIRNGEMRINIRLNETDEWSILRYTQDLEEWGITTDEQLDSWSEQTGLFEWWNNSWFEIINNDNACDCDYGVWETLTEAVEECKRMDSKGVYCG